MSCECNIGDLVYEVTIESDSNTTQDAFGEVSPVSWGTITDGVVWARAEWGFGDEKQKEDLVNSVEKIAFTIHYRSDITELMRISFDGKIYNIRSIERLDFKRWLLIRTERHG